jgi:hypothetical protein
MGKVISSASMLLDGFIANFDNTIGNLFDWFESGDVEIGTTIESDRPGSGRHGEGTTVLRRALRRSPIPAGGPHDDHSR